MSIKITPMTKRQLIGFFNEYRGNFPGWDVEHDLVFVRSEGLVKQHIAFEALRSGAYRPSCSVEVLATPGARVLHRFLNIKHREVLPREHATKRSLVLEAMEDQFQPSIRGPLNVAEVLRLTEEEVIRDKIDNINYSVALAALNAYVGNLDRATRWCDQVSIQLAETKREPADWEREYVIYTQQLRQAIIHGQEQAFLQARLFQQNQHDDF